MSDADPEIEDEPVAALTDTPAELYGALVTHPRGETVLHPSRDQYLDVVQALLDDGYLQCLDLTAADYLRHPGRKDLPVGLHGERFEIVALFINPFERKRIRVRVQVSDADPTISSLFSLHPGTEALEREVFDLFGITFDEHPDMTRILMPEDWVGHPLRRDYGIGAIPVQFKGDPSHR